MRRAGRILVSAAQRQQLQDCWSVGNSLIAAAESQSTALAASAVRGSQQTSTQAEHACRVSHRLTAITPAPVLRHSLLSSIQLHSACLSITLPSRLHCTQSQHRQHRCYSIEASNNGSTSSGGSSNSSSGGQGGQRNSGSSNGSTDDTVFAVPGPSNTLQASMEKLVDSAVSLVEEGRLQQAVDVLQQGITLLQNAFPDSPELSELHNQAALLLLFGNQHQQAAKHAADSLELTQQHFGPTHPLTGHRLLRLGTVRFASGQLSESQPLLAAAADMLSKQLQDPSLSEAMFYLNLLVLTAADSPQAVVNLTPALQDSMKHMVSTLGAESMIVRLALSAHSKLAGAALDEGLPQGEAAFKQHIALQEIQDSNGPELGLTLYQLATTYYAHDMLTDAGPALQRSSTIFKSHYPDDHDLMWLCKHRLGMICAAGRDHRSAMKLLNDTLQHYQQQQPDHPLAKEAEMGLAMASIKALDPRMSAADRTAAVEEGLQKMKAALTGMAAILGTQHLLVTAGSRYLAQLAVMHNAKLPHSK